MTSREKVRGKDRLFVRERVLEKRERERERKRKRERTQINDLTVQF